MARKITANLYMTLDGFGEFPEYPSSDVPLPGPNQMFQEMWINRYDSVDTVVFGRRSFEGHNEVHRLKNRRPDAPKHMFEYSEYLERVDKVVLSNTLTQTDWPNTRIVKGDLEDVLAKLRGEPGRKDILIDGGPAVVREVLRRGLADDYWMAMWPVVYGHGAAYWGHMPEQRTLKLLSVVRLRDGEILLHYETIR